MPIRIESANYNDLPAPGWVPTKFQTLRYTISGQADYTMGATIATAWRYTLVVSASASALGGGVSAGGLDSLRTSYGKTASGANQIQFVTNEALTASAYFTGLQIRAQLNPTMYVVEVGLARVQ